MAIAYVGLGSNLGSRLKQLRRGLELMSNVKGIRILKLSSFYATKPLHITEQPWYLNAVVKIRTTLSPVELIQHFQAIESMAKRVRIIRFGPRTLDLDLLCYGRKSMKTKVVVLPHPRMAQRAFVLKPLGELCSRIWLGNRQVSVRSLLQRPGIGSQGVSAFKKNTSWTRRGTHGRT